MNLPSKIISAAVIALAIGMSTACSSPDATPVSNEPTNPPTVTSTASQTPTDEPKRQMTGAPTLANLSGASSADGNLPEDQRWCMAWALDNLDPHVYAEFIWLDPTTMDDLDQTVWGSRLKGNSQHGYYQTLPTYDHDYGAPKPTSWANLVGTCWMYWSEPLTKANADKRNLQYEAECLRRTASRADSEWDKLAQAAVQYDDSAAYETPNQYVRVLRWLNTSGSELLAMNDPPYELLKRLSDEPYAYDPNVPTKNGIAGSNAEWWNLLSATLAHRSNPTSACLIYYPQLYYGYWVPFTERSDEPPEQLSGEEITEVERLREGPLYLPRP